MESNSVCNHTSDYKIGRPRSGSPICLSRVLLQTELDDTKSYYQLIIKITICEKRRIRKEKKRENLHKKFLHSFYGDWNQGCDGLLDWLTELSDNKLSDNKLSDNHLTSELVENRSFFKPITIEEIVIFMISMEMNL